jgi:hypothetical protein
MSGAGAVAVLSLYAFIAWAGTKFYRNYIKMYISKTGLVEHERAFVCIAWCFFFFQYKSV